MPPLLKRLVLPLVALLLAACPSAAQEPNPNVRFGLPSPAKADPKQREDYLIARPQYVLSYNAEKRTPNWVSWRLVKGDIGTVGRAPFEPDPDLPRGMARVTPHVYDRSGFDRGHMCPAKDRSRTPQDSRIVFYMTNIVPQSPASNQKGWERLEDYCRRLAQRGHELHIVCGPYGVGGVGKEGPRETIGPEHLRVMVPARLWKVVLVLPREGAEPRRNTRVIAVILPNDQTVGFDWTKYRVSARQVEKLTGYRFFANVAPEVAAALKEGVDDVEVRVSSGHGRGEHAERIPPRSGRKAGAAERPTHSRSGRAHGGADEGGGLTLPTFEPGCVIGNRRSKKYHVPGGASYERARESKNAVFFRTAQDAEKAGYTPAAR